VEVYNSNMSIEEKQSLDVTPQHADSPAILAELTRYQAPSFCFPQHDLLPEWPLTADPHVRAWQVYAERAAKEGALAVLRAVLPQLWFPIQSGISKSAHYQAATRRGERTTVADSVSGLEFEARDRIELQIHTSIAGPVPIVTLDRPDFVRLVQAVVHRNEPENIPTSMGACIVSGYNNWDRVAQLKAAWLANNPLTGFDGGWAEHFRRHVVPNKTLYQDRFILLTRGPYSGVSAEAMERDEDAWRDLSTTIRLEHECTHYFTRRILGSMRNNLLDELIADYRGIVAATGGFSAEWFLRFVGLEDFPRYRQGARLENYRGDPPLSDGAFDILCRMVRDAALSVERFHDRLGASAGTLDGQARAVMTLCRFSLAELASPDVDSRLSVTLKAMRWPADGGADALLTT